MSRAMRRASRTPASRSRRTPVRPRGSGGGVRVPWIPIAVVIAIVAVVGVVIYLVIQAGKPAADRFAAAAAMEANQTAPMAGVEYVNLPQAWAVGSTLAHYGSSAGPNTNAHVTHDVDYSKETSPSSPNGLPPVGGQHWGSSGCGSDPAAAPAFCGPAPWGIYRAPWHPETLVHNMEHGGVIVWYNTTNTGVRDQLEAEVTERLKAGNLVVMTPYTALPAETIALTGWSWREIMPVSKLDINQIDTFIKTFTCRFNPEGFTCSSQ